MALYRSPGMGLPSYLGWSVRFFSATHRVSRSAVLAVSGRVTADPEDLRRHTSHRWLFDEEKQLAARYVPFDPQALERVASEAVGSRCVRINKVAEDDFNRTLILSFENGKEVLARFPYSVLGRTDLVAASEAATTHLLGETYRIPIPKLLAYSSRAHDDTSVGAPYVLTETPPKGIVKDLGIMLDSCAAVYPFSQSGSLYFAKDVQDLPHTRDIFQGAAKAQFCLQASQYAIGPSVDWELWRGTRQHLNMDRGPWATPLACIEGTIRCQQTWLKTIPKVRDPQGPAYFDDEDASPAVHIAALEDLLTCIPHVLPDPRFAFPTLGPHYPLGMYATIDPPPCPATDWQRTVILPHFMQEVPPARRGADGSRSQAKVDVHLFGELMKVIKSTPSEIFKMSLLFHSLLGRRARDEGERPIIMRGWPLRTWQHSVHLLRMRLMCLQFDWSRCVTDGAPCPLHFSEEECEEMVYAAYHSMRRAATTWLLALTVGANPDGRVPTEKYAEARMRCDEIAEGWLPEDHGPFPFQDGGRSAMNA